MKQFKDHEIDYILGQGENIDTVARGFRDLMMETAQIPELDIRYSVVPVADSKADFNVQLLGRTIYAQYDWDSLHENLWTFRGGFKFYIKERNVEVLKEILSWTFDVDGQTDHADASRVIAQPHFAPRVVKQHITLITNSFFQTLKSQQ